MSKPFLIKKITSYSYIFKPNIVTTVTVTSSEKSN